MIGPRHGPTTPPRAPVMDQHFLKQDAAALVADTGEWCVLRPGDGRPRNVLLNVDRNPPEALKEPPTDQRRTPMIAVEGPNDATTGIPAGELDTGTWTIDVPEEVGSSKMTTRAIAKRLHVDQGMIRLELR